MLSRRIFPAGAARGGVGGTGVGTGVGSGVGSGALLFQDHGFDVTLADISSVMLAFCRWRFETRSRHGSFLDLKTAKLPAATKD